ncbi:acetyl-CoA synthetase-like protein [Thelephora ganbajun]|uniref:Acetyl-CoA synthetase-like protein n=1 Tax=Thelephora ganbajun TaxID=370292 RepID=A0ACB6Z2M8_THEGA|nr:acetyl-CoA synthetase-like protein [Thelephora ganbajun]
MTRSMHIRFERVPITEIYQISEKLPVAKRAITWKIPPSMCAFECIPGSAVSVVLLPSSEQFKQLTALLPQTTIFQCYSLAEETTGEQHDKPSVPAGVLLPSIVARVQKVNAHSTGYGHSNEEATKETFVDGWVHTGDEVTINGNMEISTGRLKEMLKVRGFQVAPAEMETHSTKHPSVSEVCVVCIPHEFHGELPGDLQ